MVTIKVTLWSPGYSACVVYTKTIIHLSVSESGGYFPPLWWKDVKYDLPSFLYINLTFSTENVN